MNPLILLHIGLFADMSGPIIDMIGEIQQKLPDVDQEMITAILDMKDGYTNANKTDQGIFEFIYQMIDDIIAFRLQPDDARILMISQSTGITIHELHATFTNGILREWAMDPSLVTIRSTFQRIYNAEGKVLCDYGLINEMEN
jgi:hypothetical protein